MSKRKSDTLLESGSTEGGSKKPRKIDPVEKANAISKDDFLLQAPVRLVYEQGRNFAYDLDLVYADKISEKQLNDCFNLIQNTSRHDYELSSFGWHPKRKLREMKEKEMRYIVLTKYSIKSEATRGDGEFAGFMSFMFTHDGTPTVPVLYIYEIHLMPAARGCGLGKYLMNSAERIARWLGMEKVMLTCFKSNKDAYSFYESLGYRIDACSPQDIKTRKKVCKSDYVIMSLDLSDARQKSGAAESTEPDEDAQVTAEDTKHSAGSADILTSSDKVVQSLKECLVGIRDDQGQRSTARTGFIAAQVFRAIDEMDQEPALRHFSRLRDRLELYQTWTVAQVKVQAALWTQTHKLKEILKLVQREAESNGIHLPEDMCPSSTITDDLSDVERSLMYHAIAGTFNKTFTPGVVTDFEGKNRKLKDLQRRLDSRQRQADQDRTALRAREQALLKRENALKLAEEHVATRLKHIDAREARIVHTMVTLAKVFDSDACIEADSKANDEKASAEDDEDESASLEESQECSATHTVLHSGESRRQRENAECGSKKEQRKRLTISNSLKLPTPEAMKWQRPRKEQVSTWLRRRGSARASFPSGKRASDM
ncbi:hypothetical protein AC579_6805 [Pseudocercospora musae]|uniref:N-alpha-acetyltransferase 40 n=1 Tax=Pseudocercospora musae TaxID=113226 RepID=A0A139IPZ1_9PEZI|nr:hypothetical protein AC579_6805 [Pseudocercospora musae]